MRRLLLLVVTLIVYGSLYPWHFAVGWEHGLINALLASLHSRWDRFAFRDVALNVLLYVPLGAAAASVARTGFGWKISRAAAAAIAVLFGAALSLTLESLQVYVPGRTPSLRDLAANTAGTAVGAFVTLVIWPELGIRPRPRGGRTPSASVFLLACWAGYQLFPLFPALSLSRLRAELALFADRAALSPVEIWAAAAGWFVAALALEALFGRLRTAWLLAAMLCLPARVFIAGRSLTLNDCLGAAVALALWAALKRWRPAGILLIGSAIVLGELAPFRFTAEASAFSWVPFAATLDSTRQSAVVLFLQKAFEYGAAVWLLHQAGFRYLRAGLGVAGGLMALEWAQRYLPGRTPEITDALLALLVTFALWGLDSAASTAD